MVSAPPYQISKSRDKRYDVLLHKPFMERSEAEYFTAYYLLRNIDMFCYFVLGTKIFPFQSIILRCLLRRPFPMLLLSRGGSKSFLLGIYSALRACITPGSKIVMVGSNRRQSRFIFDHAKNIYYNRKASLFRDLVAKPPNDLPEQSSMYVKGDDKQSMIAALPLGAGDKIRGIRSTHLLADEFVVIPKDIFNTILRPTAAVSIDPFEKSQRIKREKELVEAGVISSDDMIEFDDNQIVISSSASYEFTFLYEMYKNYRQSILAGLNTDDKEKIKRASKYCIIQLGYESILKVAPGLLDESNIVEAKKSIPHDTFHTEYGAQFVSDSAGFIPRSLLESRQLQMERLPIVETKGSEGFAYILGIDPSSGQDEGNDWFGLIVIKVDLAKRISWIVNAFGGSGKGWPYYIDLVKTYLTAFKPQYVVIDSYGGGSNLASILGSEKYSNVEKGEKLYSMMDKDNLASYSLVEGRILRMVVPTNSWNELSNVNLKSMFEHEKLWFAAPLNQTSYENNKSEEIEKLETAFDFITETKTQISLIVGSQGANGMTVFGLPQSLGSARKKQRSRKDLYSATLLAAWGVKDLFEIMDSGEKKQNKVYNPTVSLA